MHQPNSTMAEQIAQAAIAFEKGRTGHALERVTVVLGNDTLVITLHGALTPAEKVLARSPAGAAQVQEFHRQLFDSAFDPLRQEITKITGVEVVEASMEIPTTTGAVVKVFSTGTVVQVFLLAGGLAAESWSGNSSSGSS